MKGLFKLEKFDVRKYLTSQDVFFKEEGENIGNGSIGICCPSCGDDNFHLGILVETIVYNCWKCEQQGNIIGLVMLIEGIDKHQAINRIKDICDEEPVNRFNFQDKVKDILSEKETVEEWDERLKKEKLRIPCTHYLNELSPDLALDSVFLRFIKHRNYETKELMEWGVKAVVVGDFSMRLLFPITYENRLVNYLGRTVINEKNKYKNCSNDNAVIPMRQLLYGYDYVQKGQDSLVLCEGVFDVIRFGKGKAVGVFGKDISIEQMELLCSLDIKKTIWIALDGEAMSDAIKISKNIKPLVKAEVKILILKPNTDPDNYSKGELSQLIERS